MGFGYLFIGYLMTFVIVATLEQLGIGFAGLLLGYFLMLTALRRLHLYHRSFMAAESLLVPLLVIALYRGVLDLSELFLWRLPSFCLLAEGVVSIVEAVLLICFNLALLYGIRLLATEVSLPRIATAATRNAVFVGIYGVLFALAKIPFGTTQVRNALAISVLMVQLVWIFCNLWLFVTCAKDICPEGDEEIAPKRYRFEWLNRIGDAYENTRRRSIERTTKETEDALRRRREKVQTRENEHRNSNKRKKKK